jgi:putative PIN family toxin of toxin-antitoxin system
VIDTSVLVAAMRSRSGASAALLQEVAANRLEITASSALFLEYEAVLKRQEHGLSAQFVDGFLAELAPCIFPAEIWFQWRPQLPDAGDEMVLEAAMNGQAKAIVTHNKRDFEPVVGRFGIEILSPAEVLNRLRCERKQS